MISLKSPLNNTHKCNNVYQKHNMANFYKTCSFLYKWKIGVTAYFPCVNIGSLLFAQCSCYIMHISALYESTHSCCCPTIRCCTLLWIGCALNRKELRKKYRIKGDIWQDLLAWYYCPCCAGAQEFRETLNHDQNGKRIIPDYKHEQVLTEANKG